MTPELKQLYQIIDALSETERQQVAAYLQNRVDSVEQAIEDETISWSESDIQMLLTPHPQSGRDLVEMALESGAIGSWADQNINDPLTWLKQQRSQRFQW